ncbi:YccF domain-containing protein [Bacteroidales bacterium]|nr:YccF domain-containing protein [Bacteroidales bacterium]
MRLLGNILWLIFGGIAIAIEYFVASLLLCVTIVGIPFGIQTLKLGMLALWPFGRETRQTSSAGGCLYIIMNIIWLLVGGIWISLSHIVFGILLTITIIGFPFGKQHFKLAALALSPFGRDII